ncbi:Bardet-Biedl syndrome 4 protein-like, partial [Hyalella azteca]|uniref:Bardet-Biedl syndrome 4 protein-like n=1 Tax=Hyalella azteca TaxID=294128 RepID=A0A8B7PA24_HYAAZ
LTKFKEAILTFRCLHGLAPPYHTECLQRVSDLPSEDACKNLSRFLLGRHSRAIEAYKQAGNNSEKPDWEINYNLGICYQRTGQLEAAKQELQQALQLHRHHEVFKALASVYLQQSDVTAAVSTYRAAIEQFPENSDLHSSLGRLLLQTGRSQQAFEQLGAALTFNPNHSPSLLAIGAMMQV